MNSNLLYLGKPPYGGWISYTDHLRRSLSKLGKCNVIKLGNKTNIKTPKLLGGQTYYRTLSHGSIARSCSAKNSIITALDKHHFDIGYSLLNAGISIVIHDPNELNEDVIRILKTNKNKVISIRKGNHENLLKMGINSYFIKHPYEQEGYNCLKTKTAIATSRIDWDKRTEIIVESNMASSEKVHIYGHLNNQYGFFKLQPVDKNWKMFYMGKFPKDQSAATLCSPYKYCVDMSVIKGDGGGTQYTFLEAIDAGCVLVLNKKWTNVQGSIFIDGHNCISVSGAKELSSVIDSKENYSNIITNSKQILKDHSLDMIGSEFQKRICHGWW